MKMKTAVLLNKVRTRTPARISTHDHWITAVRRALHFSLTMLALLLSTVALHAETAADHAVQASATVSESPARITLSWPADPNATGWTVERKLHSDANWGTPTSLPAGTANWADNAVSVGALYEYRITKLINGYTAHWGDSAASLGYLCSGIHVALPDHRGTVTLLVDNTRAVPLYAELARLQQDLVGDGWTVIRHDVPRGDGDDTRTVDSAALTATKALIQADYNATPGEVHSVLLFGHIPVPYSGVIYPDGHSEHYGAWSADMYYGDVSGIWTDSTVNDPHPDWWPLIANIPGDGKFDQSTPPQPIAVEMGRVDLWNMTNFAKNETELLRQYLNKDHSHRHAINVLPRRALIDDRFSEGGVYMSSSGWRNWAAFFGAANVTGGVDNFSVLAGNSYLCFYGCGGGDPTDYGINRTPPAVSTSTFASTDPKAAFFLLWGSWFGDWNVQNNILRAPLATTSYGLASAWSGIPNWFMHTMAMGGTIGETTRMTQNNSSSTGIYLPHAGDNQIQIALMGDPTLRLFAVVPPTGASVTRDAGNHPLLTWTASADASLGYHVFRGSNTTGPFVRITTNPVSATTFTDSTTTATWIYQVKAAKLETTNGGTYVNLSQAATVNMLPEINSSISAYGAVNKAFSYQITATGSPTTFSATGLPGGLSLNTSNGAITGTPTEIGTRIVTLGASNSNGTGMTTITLTVTDASIGVQFIGTGTALLASDVAGVPAVIQNNWNPISGKTFTNLVLKDNAGAATTTTLAGNATGTYIATNGFAAGSGDGKLASGEVYNGNITTDTHSMTFSGIPYARYDVYVYGENDYPGRNTVFSLTPSGGVALFKSLQSKILLYNWIESTNTWDGTGTAPTLPVADYVRFTGLTASSFTLKFGAAGNGGMNGVQIVRAMAPIITSPSTANGSVGSSFSYQITAANNPTSYNAGGLPAGLTVSTSTGLIFGTPSVSGTSSITLNAINANGTGTASLTLSIYSLPLIIVPANITTDAAGKDGSVVAYNVTANDNINGALTPVCTPSSGSTFPIGTTPVNCSATNYAGTSNASFNVTVLRTYAWFQNQYGLINPNPTADPNHTGVRNLEAYAFGVNPSSPDLSQLPSLTLQGGFLQISYPRWKDASDLAYVVEVSNDLKTWNSGPSYTHQVSIIPIDTLREQVIERDQTPISGATRRFIRLNVTKP